ncbi:uncharacterized protein K460DRAFT_214510 [Cucurbitaria berberidis CBS 394.84]|uniref:Secreted protein n=1 Tax=Cucurbitaria berberidis CBS 394.84 TaxID=1168544 RepID=A0A9P4G6L9_9PLEO|nr:uncharacterized protein K460DRAFT_214510 [Cucurbitaria berberidis CBS 394.84]KAF1839973.1 hypothetical protein K460DRAFT_214510 [Cucurbitaria berberidis CBS 394.84]
MSIISFLPLFVFFCHKPTQAINRRRMSKLTRHAPEYSNSSKISAKMKPSSFPHQQCYMDASAHHFRCSYPAYTKLNTGS